MEVKNPLLSILILLCLVLFVTSCNGRVGGLNLNTDNVMKIERLGWRFDTASDVDLVWIETQGMFGEVVGRYMGIINTITDEIYITNLIDSFNAWILTPDPDGLVTSNAPPNYFRITYNDGTVDVIQFHWTSLFYNGTHFRIMDGWDVDRTSEPEIITKIEWKVIFYEYEDDNDHFFQLYLLVNGEAEYYAGSGFAPWSQLTVNCTTLMLDAPPNALSTLSSLWTGLSQQFYIYQKSDTELAVMSRFVDFMSEDREEYKKMLIIPIENGAQIQVDESLIIQEPVREPIDGK